jgi:5-methylcytosine-specific restriction protein A
MIYKRCPRCGKRIPEGTTCPDCKREYTPYKGVARLYHTSRWARLREVIMIKYDHLDLYALRHKVIRPADTIHHIVPAKEDPSRFFDPTNLIPVSRESHDEIHEAYREGGDARRAVEVGLRSILKDTL